jgi:hypothetical protein
MILWVCRWGVVVMTVGFAGVLEVKLRVWPAGLWAGVDGMTSVHINEPVFILVITGT